MIFKLIVWGRQKSAFYGDFLNKTHIKSTLTSTKRKMYLTNCDNPYFFRKFKIRNFA